MDGAISVGRNIGDTPMDAIEWADYVDMVCQTIVNEKGTVHAVTYSSGGLWQGKREDNAVVTFSIPDGHRLGRLRWYLRRIASRYEQDAIALLVGQTELVGA